MGYHLNRTQLDRYAEDGFLVVPGVFSPEELDPVRGAIGRAVDRVADELLRRGLISTTHEAEPFETRLVRILEGAPPGIGRTFGRSWREREPEFYDLTVHPKLLDMAESIIGPEVRAHPVYNARPKVPGEAYGVVAWHQDCAYLNHDLVTGQQIPAFWIPLVDVTAAHGCVVVAPGSHKGGFVPYHEETYSGTGYLEIDHRYTDGVRTVVCEMRAGDVLVLDQLCYHMSGKNTSGIVRWSVDFRYQADGLPTGFRNAGFLARSTANPDRVTTLAEWLALPERP